MLNRIIRHMCRKPIPTLAVFLFTAVLSVLLCVLHQNQTKEQEEYKQAYSSVPVYFTVVDLDGTSLDDTIVGWVADLFYPESKLKPSFSELAKDLELKMQYQAVTSNGSSMTVSGVSSVRMVPEVSQDYGGSITWAAGYDESIFTSGEYICLVPEGFMQEGDLSLSFVYKNPETEEQWSCTEHFTIAGYTTSRGEAQIYLPYHALAKILSRIRSPYNLIGISATLNDNTRLAELQEIADQWFARPNLNGEQTVWGHYGYDHYPYALDINDTLLRSLDATMERSMKINRLSAVAIFSIAAGMGFLVGFLVIRARKRDISLMRTLGCSQQSIFLELTGEQTLCAAAGMILGGSYAFWQPMAQLALFLAIYCAGLCTAALIFLRKNLLTTIKEE